MNGVHVTSHAISRYRERVEAIPEAEVRSRLSTPTFLRAIQMGAESVILPTGHRAVIEDGCVITVRPKPRPKSRRKREIDE